MPSTNVDFLKQVKKMSSDAGISINSLGDEYSMTSLNQYKRTLSIDLLGKPATNLICLVFNHYDLVNARKSALNFCDLRIWDVSELVEYEYYVQSYNTKYCCVFIKFPTALPGNSVTTIQLQYGNPALKSKSNPNIVSSKLSSDDLLYAVRANEAWEFCNYTARNFSGAGLSQVKNQGEKQNQIGWKNDGFEGKTYPSLRHDDTTLNTLPLIRFAGTQTMPETYSNSQEQRFGDNYSSFIVAKSATLAGYTRLVSFDLGAGQYNIPIYWNPGANQLFSITNVDTGPTGVLTGAVAGDWNILTTRRQRNTIAGINTFRNSVAVANANTTNTALPNPDLWIGSNRDAGEYSNADLAEVLIFNSYLTDLERLEIETYLNIKYRIESSNLPILTLGAEQANTYTQVSQSFAPFVSWNSKSELESKSWGVAGTTATADILTMMQKTIASGSPVETWSLSTLDTTNRIPSEYARTRTATTTASSDIVNIYTALDKYEYTNLITLTTSYQSDNDDYIEFDFWCQDASQIDAFNSYIEFSNFSGSIYKKGKFSFNQNPLVNGLNSIKIKKSSFIFPGTWLQVSQRLTVSLVTLSGTQECLYNNFRLTQNLSDNDYYQIQNQIRLSNCVSSDNDLTYYSRVNTLGRIVSQDLVENNLRFNISDYLEIIKDKTFGELNSFEGLNYYTWWVANELAGFSNRFEVSNIFCLERVLAFILPDWAWVIENVGFDTMVPTAGYTQNLPNKMSFFTIYKTDKVGAVLDKLLDNVLGYITYRPNIDKFIVRGGRYSNLTTLTINDNLIYNFTDETAEKQEVINEIIFENYKSNQFFNNLTLCRFDFDKDLEIPANQITQLFFDLKDFDGCENRKISGNIRVNTFGVSATRGDNTINNSGVRVKSCRVLDNQTFVVDFVSTGVSDRYLRSLRITADFLAFDPIYLDKKTIFNKKLVYDNPSLFVDNDRVVMRDRASIDKYGKNSVTLGNFAWQGVEENATEIRLRVNTYYNELLARIAKPAQYIGIETQYQEGLRIGTYVRFNNKEKKTVQGFVTKIENYSSPEVGFVSNLRIRLI